jgi:hypothetical protein
MEVYLINIICLLVFFLHLFLVSLEIHVDMLPAKLHLNSIQLNHQYLTLQQIFQLEYSKEKFIKQKKTNNKDIYFFSTNS